MLAGVSTTGLEVDKVQTALTIFVALLIEIGSGFGMYVAFAYWRINDRAPERAPAKAAVASAAVASAPVAAPAITTAPAVAPATKEAMPAAEPLAAREEEQAAVEPPAPRRLLNANDNKLPRAVPDSDVQRFYRKGHCRVGGASLTSTELYEEYCRWCENNEKEPFAHPRVTREIGELGVKKERIGKRTRYFGIALHAEAGRQEDKKLPETLSRAA